MATQKNAQFFALAKADLAEFGPTMLWKVFVDDGRGEPREIGRAAEVDVGAIIIDRPLPRGARIMLRHDVRGR